MGNDSGIDRRLKLRTLRRASTVIDALGGTAAVATLTGKSLQEISNARARNRLPPSTILVLRDELARRRCFAPASLWGALEPRSRKPVN